MFTLADVAVVVVVFGCSAIVAVAFAFVSVQLAKRPK